MHYENQVYQIGIHLKEYEPSLPDNYGMALHRLENTEKRFKRSPDIATTYSKCIKQYIEKGLCTEDLAHEQLRPKWCTYHIFWLSTCEGVFLNDVIHQEPKSQCNLFEELLHFRRFPIAIVRDIAEMNVRIDIASEDMPYHRFVWRGIDQSRHPDV